MYDTVGGVHNWRAAQHVLREGGTFLEIAGDGVDGHARAAGFSTVLHSLSSMLVRSWPWSSFWYREYGVFPNGPQLAQLAEAMAAGRLSATIDSVFTLDEAGAAFDRLMTGHARGKVIIRVHSG